MAKATNADIECALIIMGQIEDMENGTMPRTSHGSDGPTWPESDEEDYPDGFYEGDPDHCKEAVRRILDVFCARKNGGALCRVIFGMDTVLKNGVFDPETDHLSWHPDLLPAVHERERRQMIDEQMASISRTFVVVKPTRGGRCIGFVRPVGGPQRTMRVVAADMRLPRAFVDRVDRKAFAS